ncbi:MAG TPA: helix-turn-helix domain-containing protein [Candidatus Competibacteraceae bacterium]|nr:helix-turn-helix domain-containing protein [Candidatus Competibacteraceae bacterium]
MDAKDVNGLLSERSQVFDTLRRSPHTRLLQCGLAEDDLGLAVWHNIDDRIAYPEPRHHTLSVYLAGGYGTYRRDVPERHGAPGKVCTMPAGQPSDWVIDGELSFLHLYFSPDRYARLALETLDVEPRLIELQQRTYVDDGYIEQLCRQFILPLDWSERADRLALGDAANLLLIHLLKAHSQRRAGLAIRGGLAPAVRRRVLDYIDAHLDAPLTLGELATVAGLSEYHFARMFRVSLGSSPHDYVLEQRLGRARRLLSDGRLALAEIALRCGFSSQSHFGQCFRRRYGVSPGEFRRLRGCSHIPVDP